MKKIEFVLSHLLYKLRYVLGVDINNLDKHKFSEFEKGYLQAITDLEEFINEYK